MRDYLVYCHTNLVNGKLYFGVTKNKMENRAGKRGKKYRQCTYFANAIEKYGWDNFKHEIIADGLTKEEASEYEKLLIGFFQTNDRSKGYNIQPGGLHAGGMTPEGFERLRQASIEANKKPVVSFTKDGKRLERFDSITEAAKFYGISDSGIEAALYQSNHTCKNMLFRFASDVSDFVDMPESYLDEKVRVRHYKNGRHAKCADVVLFDSNGKRLTEFPSSKACAEYLGVYHGSVSAVINGKKPSVCGCYVRKKSDFGDAESICIDDLYHAKNNSVAMIDNDGNEIIRFGSLRDAIKYLGGGDHKALKKAAIDGRLYRGRRWKLL